MLSAMETEKINETQDVPVMISDAAWQSILPFLKTFPNVYVGSPETCRRFLSAVVWDNEARRDLACVATGLWVLE